MSITVKVKSYAGSSSSSSSRATRASYSSSRATRSSYSSSGSYGYSGSGSSSYTSSISQPALPAIDPDLIASLAEKYVIMKPLTNKEVLMDALDRVQVLYNYPINKWYKDFFILYQDRDGKYSLEVSINDTTLNTRSEGELFVERLYQECLKLQQESVYSQITEAAMSKGLSLNEEYIDDNDTIVLSYEIK